MFDLLKEFTPYNTSEKACRYFGADWRPYGKQEKTSKEIRLDQISVSAHGKSINACVNQHEFGRYEGGFKWPQSSCFTENFSLQGISPVLTKPSLGVKS